MVLSNERRKERLILTEPFKFLLVDTRRWKIWAGSVSFSLSDDSSTTAAAAIACVTSLGNGDGVRDEDDPIDVGIDNGDLLFAIVVFFVDVRVKFNFIESTFFYFVRCHLLLISSNGFPNIYSTCLSRCAITLTHKIHDLSTFLCSTYHNFYWPNYLCTYSMYSHNKSLCFYIITRWLQFIIISHTHTTLILWRSMAHTERYKHDFMNLIM